jgi:thiopeptide-type bacteriocin biosynthesis protein
MTLRHHDAIRALLTADTDPAIPLLVPGRSAATAATWLSGFRHAGQAFASAASQSQLQRGLRDILAHLIIFHWNRLGLTAAAQAILARAAQDVIMSTAASPGPAAGQ